METKTPAPALFFGASGPSQSAVFFHGRFLGRCQRAEVHTTTENRAPIAQLNVSMPGTDLGDEALSLEELKRKFPFCLYSERPGYGVCAVWHGELIGSLSEVHFVADCTKEPHLLVTLKVLSASNGMVFMNLEKKFKEVPWIKVEVA